MPTKCASRRPVKCRSAAVPGSLYCASCRERNAAEATRYAVAVAAQPVSAMPIPHGPGTGRGLCTREHPCGDCDVCAFIANRPR